MSLPTELSALVTAKTTLAENLTTMGQSATYTESLGDLAGKVLNISDEATAVAGDIASGKTAYSGGALITGTGSGASVLTGDAVVGEVLAGKTFYSNDPNTILTGTMTDRTGDNACTSSSVSGTTLKLVAPTGFYDGTDTVTITDADFTAANIRSGTTVLGVTGTMEAKETIDEYTKVLLHFDGEDNGTTFTDASGKTWTATGTAVTSATKLAYGTASGYFDGNSDYISTPDSEDFYLGADNWTIEWWVNFASLSGQHGGIFEQVYDGNMFEISFYNTEIGIEASSGGVRQFLYLKNLSISTNTWYHMAFERNGTNMLFFLNGVQQTLTENTAISTKTIPNIAAPAKIGFSEVYTRYMNGYIDEFRLSKGVARWLTNFVPGCPYPS